MERTRRSPSAFELKKELKLTPSLEYPDIKLGAVRFSLYFIQVSVVRAVECSYGRVCCNAGRVSVLGKDIAGLKLIVGGDRGDQ